MFDESVKSPDYSLAPSLNYTSIYTLFGAVKLTKNADFDKYKHSGYCIGFLIHVKGICYLMVMG